MNFIKFCVKNNIKCSEVVKMLKWALVRVLCPNQGYKHFQEGHEYIEDDKRIVHPTTLEENVEKLRILCSVIAESL